MAVFYPCILRANDLIAAGASYVHVLRDRYTLSILNALITFLTVIPIAFQIHSTDGEELITIRAFDFDLVTDHWRPSPMAGSIKASYLTHYCIIKSFSISSYFNDD